MVGVALRQLRGLADHSFAERHAAVERVEHGLSPLHDNATEKVAFLSDAEAGAGGDFLFKAEPKHDLIEAGLGVLFEEFDGCDKDWSPQPTEKLWSKPIFCMKCQPRDNPGYVRNERT
ncbi:hypothetical protein [Bradyrhizobium hipponense]|uniref:hypothetical protein n=1 Tax=Bradyrhizobium hipponense TaxID=2605638 RepID=UPI001652F4B2|nr:hypothetical protein [Bradyrhizobium hipponense]